MDCNIKNYKTLLNSNNPIHCLHKNFKLPFTNMKIKYTTTKEMKEVIKLLKSKNCHEYDEISMKILQVSTDCIISPGVFPSRLKFSSIKLFYKKGDRTNIKNFRPVSLLTSFPKVLEKVIYTRLHQHINKIIYYQPKNMASEIIPQLKKSSTN